MCGGKSSSNHKISHEIGVYGIFVEKCFLQLRGVNTFDTDVVYSKSRNGDTGIFSKFS